MSCLPGAVAVGQVSFFNIFKRVKGALVRRSCGSVDSSDSSNVCNSKRPRNCSGCITQPFFGAFGLAIATLFVSKQEITIAPGTLLSTAFRLSHYCSRC